MPRARRSVVSPWLLAPVALVAAAEARRRGVRVVAPRALVAEPPEARPRPVVVTRPAEARGLARRPAVRGLVPAADGGLVPLLTCLPRLPRSCRRTSRFVRPAGTWLVTTT